MTLERGTVRGSSGKDAGCRSRQAAWRHASAQKRRRPYGTNPPPHIAHRRVIAPPPLSLLNGDSVLVALALALCQSAFEAERVRTRLDDVGAVGDAVQHRFAQPSVRDD